MGQALFIVWRESIEALLVVGILYAWLQRQPDNRLAIRHLWGGVALGLGLASLLGAAMMLAGSWLNDSAGEWFQAGMTLCASLLILHMLAWMARHGRQLRRELESQAGSALLIESRTATASVLAEQIERIMASIAEFPLEKRVDFSSDPAVYNQLWKIRKDTFPAVGAVRATGTTVIIEDVTFPVEALAEGVNRLLELFDRHGYFEAIIFGHALEGNLHFVFTQGFDDPAQVARYDAFMGEVAQLVAVEFGGALKAEHGTGRNMAPFVELEWGNDAYQLMWAIKRLLDPQGILNPDVILSEDRELHLKNLKPLPAADEIVDKCIECGFCEPV